ncbi:MAG: DNA polymerase II [Immundisolibacterales bacterium]|nr:DNA polymerase II [Immundisolibacterales bacterium]
MESTVEAFLLTRDWRDTPRGLEIVLWACGAAGPVRAVLREQEAICFVPRPQVSPPSVRRRQVALTALDGRPVDALYFRSRRELDGYRDRPGIEVLESDVRPADRFLMERFVTGPVTFHGRAQRRPGFLEYLDPKVRPGEMRPDLRIVSLDIETSGLDGEDREQRLWSIAVSADAARAAPGEAAQVTPGAPATPQSGAGAGPGDPAPAATAVTGTAGRALQRRAEAVFVVDPDAVRAPPGSVRLPTGGEPCPVHRLADEPAVLRAFLEWMARNDPDIVIGWNVTGFDLRFLEARCRLHRMKFALGRDAGRARVLDGALATARVPGRVVLDGIEGHRAAFWGFEDESLGAVARELLGRGKLIAPERNRVEAIRELYENDRLSLAAYNLEDCRLVREIFDRTRLVDFMVERSRITGLALGRTGGAVAAFDHLYLPRLHRRGRVAPDIGASPSTAGESPGGHVLESRPGLYRNVALLDFKSLYPSIVRTFRIDPLGLAEPGEDPVPGFAGATYAREGGILPELISTFWERREEAKRTGDQPFQHAVKILMNSFYGVLGARGCRFFDPRLASSITMRGHEIIRRSRAFIEDAGFEVIYGDTDSLFVLLGTRGGEREAASEIAERLNGWWGATLAREHRLESCLEVEFETLFERFLMPTLRGASRGTKKRYAGLVRDRDGAPELVFKGLETVRTDWTPLARRFQRELYRKVFVDEPYEDYVRATHDALLAGELDGELAYRKRLRRPIDAYTRNIPPHVQAARRQTTPGSWVSYVVTANGPLPLDALDAKPDYEHYRDRQLAPAADGILHFLGTSFETLTTEQLF